MSEEELKKTGEVVVNMRVDEDALKRMAVKIIEENDFVKVVRCKDCIHNGSIDTDCPFGWKDKKFNMPKPNDFCSQGEERRKK